MYKFEFILWLNSQPNCMIPVISWKQKKKKRTPAPHILPVYSLAVFRLPFGDASLPLYATHLLSTLLTRLLWTRIDIYDIFLMFRISFHYE